MLKLYEIHVSSSSLSEAVDAIRVLGIERNKYLLFSSLDDASYRIIIEVKEDDLLMLKLSIPGIKNCKVATNSVKNSFSLFRKFYNK